MVPEGRLTRILVPLFATLALGFATIAAVSSRNLSSGELASVPHEWLLEIADLNFSSFTNNQVAIESWLRQGTNARSPAGLFYRFVIINRSQNPDRQSLAALDAEIKVNCPPEILIFQSAQDQFLALLRRSLVIQQVITNVPDAQTDAVILSKLADSDLKLFVAAKMGHAVAEAKLGDRYLGTDGPTRLPYDPEEGLRWHFKSAGQGSQRSRVRVVALLTRAEVSTLLPEDKWPVVLRWASDLSKTNAEANLLLGLNALNNAEKESDFVTSLASFERASALGNAIAHGFVGRIHLTGLAGKTDERLARAAFQRGAAVGDLDSITALGELEYYGFAGATKPNFGAARFWFEKGAAKSDPTCLYHLGLLDISEKLDLRSAFSRFVKAADQGHQEAKLYQALLLERDASSPEIMEQVVALYSELAAEGSARARYALARLIEANIVEGASIDLAASMYLSAAQDGYWLAQDKVAKLYGAGNGLPQSISEMMRWVELAANNGSVDAAVFAAKWYEKYPSTAKIARRFRALEQSNATQIKERRSELFPNNQ